MKTMIRNLKAMGLCWILSIAGWFPGALHADVSVVGTDTDALWNAGTMTVSAPASVADGDVMVMLLGASDTTPLTALAGWKQITTKGPADISLTSLYKVYRTGDVKTFKIATHHASFAALISVRGADAANPIVDKGAIKDNNGSNDKKGESHAPGVNSVAGGLLLCAFVWDDPYQNVAVPGMKVLASYKNGDDGLTVASQSTRGGTTGERVARAPAVVAGGGNEVGMSISLRPKPLPSAKTRTRSP